MPSWVSYRDFYAVADERIDRSLDVLQEHALKVFETVDRTFAEVDEIVRGMSDDEIRAAQPTPARPPRSISPTSCRNCSHRPDRPRRPAAGVEHAAARCKAGVDFADRDYFKAAGRQRRRHLCERRAHADDRRASGGDFFDLSRRLRSADESFQRRHRGRGAAELFRGFLRDDRASRPAISMPWCASDGVFLARYPAPQQPLQQLEPAQRAARRPSTTASPTTCSPSTPRSTACDRRIGFRKLAGYPVYALAGIDSRRDPRRMAAG